MLGLRTRHVLHQADYALLTYFNFFFPYKIIKSATFGKKTFLILKQFKIQLKCGSPRVELIPKAN